MAKPIIMRSSSQSSNKQQGTPRFECKIHIDADGVTQIKYDVLDGFPKNLVVPGLLAVAQHFKLNVLDHLMPDEHDDKLLGILDKIATEGGEASPEMAKVLQLDTSPTKETE